MNLELILFGAGIPLLILSWRFMIRRTALDHARDKLFDLRDELKNTFLATEHGLNHKVYANLREDLNNQIRLVHVVSLWDLLTVQMISSRFPDSGRALFEDVKTNSLADDPELSKIASDIQSKASSVTFDYLIFSSLSATLMILFIILPIFKVKSWLLPNRKKTSHISFCGISEDNAGARLGNLSKIPQFS